MPQGVKAFNRPADRQIHTAYFVQHLPAATQGWPLIALGKYFVPGLIGCEDVGFMLNPADCNSCHSLYS